jgi:hypothetical protein
LAACLSRCVACFNRLAREAATLRGGVAGLFLQSFLPEKHTADRSRDMLAAIVGPISVPLALVLVSNPGRSPVSRTMRSEIVASSRPGFSPISTHKMPSE